MGKLGAMRAGVRGHATGALAALTLALIGVSGAAQAGGPEATTRPMAPKGGEQGLLIDVIDETIEIRDGQSDEPILMPRKLRLAYDYKGLSLKPKVDIKPREDGFDLVYHFENTSDQPKPLGGMGVGFFTLGPKVSYLKPEGAVGTATADIRKFESDSFVYPTRSYSPVMALWNERVAVGVSVLYPVDEYQHDVRVALVSADEPASDSLPGGRGWAVDVRLSNLGDERDTGTLKYSAQMRPGEVREYTIAVRVSKRADQWARTLVPYREYFASRYGGVSYDRDSRPVMPWAIAEAGSQNGQNPLGFFGPVQWRPDIFGWSQVIKSINLNTSSFGRVVLMAPGGLYPTQTAHNPPFQMATPWRQNPQLVQALDPERGLRGLTRHKRQLGLWWGNSIRPSKTWDSPEMQVLDIASMQHRELARAELDTAVEAGAKLIVLGDCSPEVLPAWQIASWVRVLKEQYPGVKFVVAPISCDLVHAIAPGVVQGWGEPKLAKSTGDLLAVKGPHLLADFLLPGHETWASFEYSAHRSIFKVQPTVATVLRDMRQVASCGYVPFFMELGGDGRHIKAASTWETSVPADLQKRRQATEPLPPEGEDHAGPNLAVRAGDDETVISDGNGEITRISKPLVGPSKGAPGKSKPKPKGKTASSKNSKQPTKRAFTGAN